MLRNLPGTSLNAPPCPYTPLLRLQAGAHDDAADDADVSVRQGMQLLGCALPGRRRREQEQPLQHRDQAQRRPQVAHRRLPGVRTGTLSGMPATAKGQRSRSEEHTSELQSLMRISTAVFRLKK